GDGPLAFERMHQDLDRVWAEVGRVLIDGGVACINIGDATRTVADRFRLYSNHARIVSRFIALGFDALPAIIWRKQTNAPNKFMGSGMLPAGAYVTLEHEYILVFRNGARRSFDAEERKAARRRSAYFWEERNRWFSDLWDFKGVRQALAPHDPRLRSAAFPFELAYRLISMYSCAGDTVLDPFAGTGTTTLAAIAAARDSIGVEIDPGMLPAVRARVDGCAPALNDYLRQRISGHLEFCATREDEKGAPLKYRSANHGFPVMTAQEVDVLLQVVVTVSRTEAGWVAEHDPLGRVTAPADLIALGADARTARSGADASQQSLFDEAVR
ncbi:MAG: site-specific DNA-methyltransferase, partial [Spirochaetaceae bacterium]